VVTLVDELLHTAVLRGASDIHLDPEADAVRVRLRVHGELEVLRDLPRDSAGEVVSRIKVMAGMDIAERRAPQDGHFRIAGTPPVDVRAAVLPARRGEKVTLRLFVQSVSQLSLDGLGLGDGDRTHFTNAIRRPHGLILITGPTGSGKSTTLYSGLRLLQASEPLNILTVEDPVEFELTGVTQMDISQGGERLTFANALRASLRHDPDVIMMGEIRDRETAELAIRAALTGHLVLSTLHTNSAVGAVTRLIDMGIQPFLIGATLRLVVAQRLVRRLCPVTWSERALSAAEARSLGRDEISGMSVREPQGSIYNANRGYVGRLGIFECLPVDEALGRAIAEGMDEPRLTALIRSQGVATLVDDAVAKLKSGVTTYAEVAKAVTVW
jgi:type II secretory ATPase GspE/PulE/Tfp pilus assembly ATPase PilB-like protein